MLACGRVSVYSCGDFGWFCNLEPQPVVVIVVDWYRQMRQLYLVCTQLAMAHMQLCNVVCVSHSLTLSPPLHPTLFVTLFQALFQALSQALSLSLSLSLSQSLFQCVWACAPTTSADCSEQVLLVCYLLSSLNSRPDCESICANEHQMQCATRPHAAARSQSQARPSSAEAWR